MMFFKGYKSKVFLVIFLLQLLFLINSDLAQVSQATNPSLPSFEESPAQADLQTDNSETYAHTETTPSEQPENSSAEGTDHNAGVHTQTPISRPETLVTSDLIESEAEDNEAFGNQSSTTLASDWTSTSSTPDSTVIAFTPTQEYYIDPEIVELPNGAIPNRETLFFETSEQLERYLTIATAREVARVEIPNTLVAITLEYDTGNPLPNSQLIARREPDYYASALTTEVNDPHVLQQWGLHETGALEAQYELSASAPRVVVAVLDSGVCSHVELEGDLLPGWNFVTETNDVSDYFGHGCAISAIMAANSNNNIGIVGIAPNAHLLPLKVLDGDGRGTYSDIAEAIVYAVDTGADIINLSLGGNNTSYLLEQAVSYAANKGVPIVAAAGNHGHGGVLYPAAYHDVTAVGALDPSLQVSSFSARGHGTDYWAPGRNIYSLTLDGTFAEFTGTSFAAAHITGLMALSQGLERDLLAEWVDRLAGVPEEDTSYDYETTSELHNSDKIDLAVLEQIAQQGSARVLVNFETSPIAQSVGEETAIALVQEDILQALSTEVFQLSYQYETVPLLVGTVDERGVSALDTLEQVVSVRLDLDTITHLNQVRDIVQVNLADELFLQETNQNLTGEGITVAVIDSGADVNHIALSGRVVEQQCFLDRSVGSQENVGQCPNNQGRDNNVLDVVGHGTVVSSILVGQTPSNQGIAPGANLVLLQALNDRGVGYVSDWMAALEWLLQNHETHNIQIVNMSLGTSALYEGACDAEFPEISGFVTQLRREGVLIFASSGNNGGDGRISSPACINDVVAVAATYDREYTLIPSVGDYRLSGGTEWPACTDDNTTTSEITCFSNMSVQVDLAAPGAIITAARLQGGTAESVGTSMASPVAAGIATLMLQANPDLLPVQIESILEASNITATTDDPHRSPYSVPRVDALQAIEAVLLSNFSCAVASDVPIAECEALANLYSLNNGIEWVNNQGWMESSQVCSWYGIECNNEHVTAIALSNNNLIGELVPDLSALTHLTSLNLSSNELYGEVSAELGTLSQLQFLDLSSNQLQSIAPELGNLAQLEELLLDRNQIRGSFPETLVDMQFDITYNAIDHTATAHTQTLPPTNVKSVIENGRLILSWDMPAFQPEDGYYVIGYQQDDDIHFLYNTLDLQTAEVDLTELLAEVPGGEYDIFVYAYSPSTGTPEDGNWQQNAILSDASEVISINVPSRCDGITTIGIEECRALEYFYIATEGYQWTNNLGWWDINVPVCEWYGLTCDGNVISEINLISNNLNGNLPALYFNQLKNLKTLRLSGNAISGSLPSLGGMNQLEIVDLSNNNLVGGISQITFLPSLRILNLENNDFSGILPIGLSQLTNLEELKLGTNDFLGALPPDIGDLSNLKLLNLSANQLNLPLPASLGRLPNIMTIDLADNDIPGEVPAAIQNATTLQTLILKSNSLSGSLPVLGMSNLQVLDLSDNQFEGFITNAFSDGLPSLTHLNVSSNFLQGTVPALNLPNLEELSVAYNALDGVSPDLGSLLDDSLESADFSHNKFQTNVAIDVLLFLDTVDRDWRDTQVVPPASFVASAAPRSRVNFTWEAVRYQMAAGSYRISCGIEAGGPYDAFSRSVYDLSLNTILDVPGFTPETEYFCIIRTTVPADGGMQKNELVSAVSAEATVLVSPADSNSGFLGIDATEVVSVSTNRLQPVDDFRGFYVGSYLDRTPDPDNNFSQSHGILDFSNISLLPANTIVESAILIIYPYGYGTNLDAVYVDRLIGPWQAITWGQIALEGIPGSGNIPITRGIPAQPASRTIELDPELIQRMREDGNYTLVLASVNPTGPNADDGLVICSEDHEADDVGGLGNICTPDHIPTLAISYRVNFAPTIVTNVAPANGADEIDPDLVQLEWEPATDPDSDPITYTLHIGEEPNTLEPVLANIQSTQITNIPGITFGKTYYWQIWASDSYEATPGPIWSFTTIPPVVCDEIIGLDQGDCEALTTIFESLGGSDWKNADNWLRTLEPCNPEQAWLGVACNGNRVRLLSLANNGLEGVIPAEAIGQLTALEEVFFNDNQIVGTLPDTLGNLAKLKQLNLSNNRIAGALPNTLGNLTNLTLLSLNNNRFSGAIPNALSYLTSLTELQLASNQLHGNIPSSLGELNALEGLDLSENAFLGEIPASITQLALLTLDISYNALFANDATVIDYLETLQVDWKATQTVPPEAIEVINVTSYSIEVSWHEIDYSENSGGYEVVLSDGTTDFTCITSSKSQTSCTVEGLLPESDYSLQVTTYTLAHGSQDNDLTSAPSQETTLTTETSFCTSVNNLDPQQCRGLEALYLALDGDNWNNNSGWLNSPEVCDDWFGVTCEDSTLLALNLADNRLNGQLPQQIGDMHDLEALDLSGNIIRGEVPSSIPALTQLTSFDLSYNLLYTSDATVQSFLNERSPGWDTTQTISPTNILVADITTNSLQLTWNPIPYQGNDGAYEVQYRPRRTGNEAIGCTTGSKSVNECTLESLNSATAFDIQLRTITEPHADQENQLVSNFSGTTTIITNPTNHHIDSATPIVEPPFGDIQDIEIEDWLNNNSYIPSCSLASTNGRYYSFGGGRYYTFGGGRYYSFGGGRYYSFGGGLFNINAGSPSLNLVVLVFLVDENNQIVELECERTSQNSPITLNYLPPDLELDYYVLVGSDIRNSTALQAQALPEQEEIPYFRINIDTIPPVDCQAVTTVATQDCEALAALFESTNGNTWTSNGRWGFDPQVCSWSGVRCAGGRVIGLNLANRNLNGSLPSEMSQLTALQMLDLSNNAIVGNLPEIDAPYLRFANFANNAFSGRIPASWSHLENLEWLSLAQNRLTGSIPPELGQLPLGTLYLQNNALSGALPLDFIMNAGLANLDVSYNKLSLDDTVVQDFLQGLNPHALETQTVAPTEVAISIDENNRFTVSWMSPIYQGNVGHIEILMAHDPAGPFEQLGQTDSKATTQFISEPMPNDRTFYIVTRTFTAEHNLQQNALTSDYSSVVATRTGINGIECVDLNGQRDLQTEMYPGPGENEWQAVILNTSETCSYEVGMASYQKFERSLYTQRLFASFPEDISGRGAVVAPGQTVTISVAVPTCAAQIDVFFDANQLGEGDAYDRVPLVLPRFGFINAFGEVGTRYGDRLDTARHINGENWCDPELSHCSLGEMTVAGLPEDGMLLSTVNVQATFNGAYPPTQVIFDLYPPEGEPYQHVESYSPWYLFGDVERLPRGWNTTLYPSGDYRLVVTPYQDELRCDPQEFELTIPERLEVIPICQGKWQVNNANDYPVTFDWTADTQQGSGVVNQSFVIYTDTDATSLEVSVDGIAQASADASAEQCLPVPSSNLDIPQLLEADAFILRGEWTEVSSVQASDGTYLLGQAGARLLFAFEGDVLEFVLLDLAPSSYQIKVDGEIIRVVTERETLGSAFGYHEFIAGLGAGDHIVEIEVLEGTLGIDNIAITPGTFESE